jgi:hypothetical protein
MTLNLTRPAPSWLTRGLLAAVVVGGLAAYGWIAPFIHGPDFSLATIYQPKPAPVKVETVKWLTKVKTEKVTVPVEVIRELPAKEAAHLEKDFGLKLDLLHAENKELAKVLDVPKAPNGGEMALTVNTATGAIDGVFSATRAPFFHLGGMREIGVGYDVIQRGIALHYSQDLARVGPVVLSGTVFASTPTVPGARPSYGGRIDGVVRF